MTEENNVVRFTVLDNGQQQRIGIATLNAPRSLNALSLEMIDKLYATLCEWAVDSQIYCVVLQGSGDKAFCAGGDIVELYHSMVEKPAGPNPYAEAFFSHEYRLDYLIHTYPKPVICLGKGIVMGGGLGLFAGASHRIVSENTRIAMPEITIGLFPDVGGSWFLNRMPEGVGLFIGLTGASINATDALDIGLASDFLPTQNHSILVEQLAGLNWPEDRNSRDQLIQQIIRQLNRDTSTERPPTQLMTHLSLIQSLTDKPSLDKVVDAILCHQTDNTWLHKAQKALKHGCPTTAHIVWQQLHEHKQLSLAEVFKRELILAIQCTRQGEFQEGVRALLIEKDGKPKWHYSSVEEVSASWLGKFNASPWPDDQHPLRDM